MKVKELIILVFLIISTTLSAQNVIRERIKNSIAFREAAEMLQLEPGSYHTVKTAFTIDNTGILEDITATAEYPELEVIAIAILEDLPLEEAPKHSSTKKNRITLEMKFYVETETQKRYRLRKESRQKKLQEN
jgi:hypothetical protein